MNGSLAIPRLYRFGGRIFVSRSKLSPYVVKCLQEIGKRFRAGDITWLDFIKVMKVFKLDIKV